MRKHNENTKTQAGSIYGKTVMKGANKHMTEHEFFEAMKPKKATCNTCGILITDKEEMKPCGPYQSSNTGIYVCPHCYDKYVKPFVDGIFEMKRTTARKALMNENTDVR